MLKTADRWWNFRFRGGVCLSFYFLFYPFLFSPKLLFLSLYESFIENRVHSAKSNHSQQFRAETLRDTIETLDESIFHQMPKGSEVEVIRSTCFRWLLTDKHRLSAPCVPYSLKAPQDSRWVSRGFSLLDCLEKWVSLITLNNTIRHHHSHSACYVKGRTMFSSAIILNDAQEENVWEIIVQWQGNFSNLRFPFNYKMHKSLDYNHLHYDHICTQQQGWASEALSASLLLYLWAGVIILSAHTLHFVWSLPVRHLEAPVCRQPIYIFTLR